MYDIRRDKGNLGGPTDGQNSLRSSVIPVAVVIVAVLALLVVIAIFTGIIGLMMIGVVALLLSIFMVHYLTWGWWLSGTVQKDDEHKKSHD